MGAREINYLRVSIAVINQHDKEQLQQDKIQLSRQLQIKDKKLEKGIVNLIQRIKNEGKTPADAECALEDVFSLDKKEAKDKVMLYWEKK